MKTYNKIIWTMVMIPVIGLMYLNVSLFFQLSSNSTYAVREITETRRLEGLIGIEEIINQDYQEIFNILLLNSVTILALLLGIILLLNTKKSENR
jgi:hypothetical protein